jgi:hypothetical protein
VREGERKYREGRNAGGLELGGACPRRRRLTPAAGTLPPSGELRDREGKCLGFSRVTGRRAFYSTEMLGRPSDRAGRPRSTGVRAGPTFGPGG